MKNKNKQGFTLVELLVVIGILGILAGALFPAISSAMLKATMTSVKTKGRNIYMAIVSANTEREPLGLGNIWPRCGGQKASDDTEDINGQLYNNSTDYFWALVDGNNMNQEDHTAVAEDFNLSQLAGAGVAAHSGTEKLKPENNMWSIGANIRDEMNDIIPILVTRNCDCSELYGKLEKSDNNRMKNIGRDYSTPFSNKGFVIVRKGGASLDIKPRYSSSRVIYEGQTFDASQSTESLAAFTYLSPKSEVKPK